MFLTSYENIISSPVIFLHFSAVCCIILPEKIFTKVFTTNICSCIIEIGGEKVERTIFHIDANSAFLSWSAVKLLNEWPPIDLRSVPSVVGGSEQSRKGIVLASSIPAKQLGIKTGETLYSARLKCPELIVVPPDFELYEDMSAKFFKICNSFSPLVQKFSIDELFLDYTNMEPHFGPPLEGAKKISEKIKSELGFTVNIGISTNKLLAKMASDFEKPDKIHTLYPDEIKEKMWPLPIGNLFMVGRQTKKKLLDIGIDTIGKLANCDIEIMKKYLKSHGELIHKYANGIDASLVTTEKEPYKSISNGSTLPRDISDKGELLKYALSLCEKVCSRLSKEGVSASVVDVGIRFKDLSYCSHQKKLLKYIYSTNDVYSAVKDLVIELWSGETPVRAITIGLSDLVSNEYQQCSFFDDDKSKKYEKIDGIVDELREKYGFHCITRASLVDDKFHKNVLKHQNPSMKSYL